MNTLRIFQIFDNIDRHYLPKQFDIKIDAFITSGTILYF